MLASRSGIPICHVAPRARGGRESTKTADNFTATVGVGADRLIVPGNSVAAITNRRENRILRVLTCYFRADLFAARECASICPV